MRRLNHKVVILLFVLTMSIPGAAEPESMAAPPPRIVRPDLSIPFGMNFAESVFRFEVILLNHGNRIIRHIYVDTYRPVESFEFVENDFPTEGSSIIGPAYIFRFKTESNLDGEMVLRIDNESRSLVFETAVIEIDDGGFYRSRNDQLITDIIQDIKEQLL